jgi:hypothetical protein
MGVQAHACEHQEGKVPDQVRSSTMVVRNTAANYCRRMMYLVRRSVVACMPDVCTGLSLSRAPLPRKFTSIHKQKNFLHSPLINIPRSLHLLVRTTPLKARTLTTKQWLPAIEQALMCSHAWSGVISHAVR